MKSLEDLLAKQKDQVKKKMMHLHVDGKKNIFSTKMKLAGELTTIKGNIDDLPPIY